MWLSYKLLNNTYFKLKQMQSSKIWMAQICILYRKRFSKGFDSACMYKKIATNVQGISLPLHYDFTPVFVRNILTLNNTIHVSLTPPGPCIIRYIVCIYSYSRGQGCMLHCLVSVVAPWHCLPPWRGMGLIHALVLDCTPPPQLTEHSEQLPNSLKPPSTDTNKVIQSILLSANTVHLYEGAFQCDLTFWARCFQSGLI